MFCPPFCCDGTYVVYGDIYCDINYRCKLAGSVPPTSFRPMSRSVGVGRPSPVIQDGARGKAKLEENIIKEARSKRSCRMALFQRHNQGT